MILTEIEWAEENGTDVRNKKAVKLYNISPVTYPAYGEGTSVGLRSCNLIDIKNEWQEWRAKVGIEKRVLYMKGLK